MLVPVTPSGPMLRVPANALVLLKLSHFVVDRRRKRHFAIARQRRNVVGGTGPGTAVSLDGIHRGGADGDSGVCQAATRGENRPAGHGQVAGSQGIASGPNVDSPTLDRRIAAERVGKRHGQRACSALGERAGALDVAAAGNRVGRVRVDHHGGGSNRHVECHGLVRRRIVERHVVALEVVVRAAAVGPVLSRLDVPGAAGAAGPDHAGTPGGRSRRELQQVAVDEQRRLGATTGPGHGPATQRVAEAAHRVQHRVGLTGGRCPRHEVRRDRPAARHARGAVHLDQVVATRREGVHVENDLTAAEGEIVVKCDGSRRGNRNVRQRVGAVGSDVRGRDVRCTDCPLVMEVIADDRPLALKLLIDRRGERRRGARDVQRRASQHVDGGPERVETTGEGGRSIGQRQRTLGDADAATPGGRCRHHRCSSCCWCRRRSSAPTA